MATRSTISLKIAESDKGKVFHFDESKLPILEEVGEKVTCMNDFIDKVGDVKLEKDYLTIYHHWDGYPEGVGDTLTALYDNYETILNLLCGGDASTINDMKICQYCAWRDEDWDSVQPKQSDEEPSVTEEYAYLFKDGKWFFKGYEAEEWTDLKEYLLSNSDEDE